MKTYVVNDELVKDIAIAFQEILDTGFYMGLFIGVSIFVIFFFSNLAKLNKLENNLASLILNYNDAVEVANELKRKKDIGKTGSKTND